MAHTTQTTAVTTSPAALHSAGPTSVKVKNSGLGTVFIGPTGAGNQRYPLYSGQTEQFTIGASDVLFAVSESGINSVTVWFI